MGSSVIDQDYPYDILHRGKSDENRHNKRVNDAVRKQLKDIVSQQDIITSEGNKKVKVKLKYLDQYRFIHNKDHYENIGRDEFDDLEEEEILYRPESGDGDGGGAGEGKATDDLGEELYEAEYTIDEITDMMIEELNLPNLKETSKMEIVSDVLEWTDRRKETGVILDKKKTILSNILRKAKMRKTKTIPIINDDLRFKTWNIAEEKHSNAVVFLMADRSGSMYGDRLYAVKSLYFWIVQFLKRKYNRIEIKFISHDYSAKEMTEKEFFTISEDGGTLVSSAYKLCKEMIQYNYPASLWNIYCFHASDGDSFGDEDQCGIIIEDIIKLGATLFAYTEVTMDRRTDYKSRLMKSIEKQAKKYDEILTSAISERTDILNTLDKFLKHSTRKSLENV